MDNWKQKQAINYKAWIKTWKMARKHMNEAT